MRYFLAGRVFFLISLFAFMAGQAAYVHHDGTESYVDNLAASPASMGNGSYGSWVINLDSEKPEKSKCSDVFLLQNWG